MPEETSLLPPLKKLRGTERQKQGMCHVTNTAGDLYLAFLGFKHFVLKLSPKVYAMYYTLM